MDRANIAKAVNKLHLAMWRDRHALLPSRHTIGPFEVIQPELAAKHFNVDFQVHDSLGQFGSLGDRFEVAGIINRDSNIIAVSRRFRTEVMRFTAGHEVGHLVLHPGSREQHRDRPIAANRADYQRSPEEREADYFSACFLMPEKLLRKEVESTFGVRGSLIIDDDVAFYLRLDRRRDAEHLQAAATVASAEDYGGLHFQSLARKFGVSAEAMAIRLDELGLVRDG